MASDRRLGDDRATLLDAFDGGDVPQFSPHLSVYALPPDVLCLYSEHRKFFLHGPLYRAIADAIAAKMRFREIVRALEPDFPLDQIHAALNRLLERGYIVRNARGGGPANAYWATLGLPQEMAARNLSQTRVRVQAIDAEGKAELEGALQGFGVRLVQRSADLTVTLVNDYLDARLAAVNRRHLAEGKAWLLCQPTGLFPLVGPVFRPHESACWTCLADRMKWNREVRAFLDRKQARPIAESPLARTTFGAAGTSFIAVEIAKAVATGFRTDLRDSIVSFEMLGTTTARHHVPHRPQCPSCGSAGLHDPTRAPTPIVLEPGGKLVMTSGGYRSLSPAATLAKHRNKISPLTGVVTRLEPMVADLSLNTSYIASHNFSPRPATVQALKSGLKGDSYGKGSTSEQAQASALMEAIERYSGIFQGDEIRLTRRFSEFAPGEALAPNDVMLLSEVQYRRGDSETLDQDESVPKPFDQKAEIEWSPVWSLRDECFRYLPTSMLYYFRRGPGSGSDWTTCDSNGCAAGNTFEEAIVQGFLELVERDAYAIWWYNRLHREPLDLDRLDDTYIRDLRAQLTGAGRKLWVLDITNDLGIPTFVAITQWEEGGREFVEFGSGAHFDTRIAALRAITELNQFFSIGLLGRRSGARVGHGGDTPWLVADNPYFAPHGAPTLRPSFGRDFGLLDKREQVLACVELARSKGLDFLVLDQTRPDIGVPIARVIVPGLRHFYRRYGPGRLYDVPVAMRHLKAPTAEDALNPLFPPT